MSKIHGMRLESSRLIRDTAESEGCTSAGNLSWYLTQKVSLRPRSSESANIESRSARATLERSCSIWE